MKFLVTTLLTFVAFDNSIKLCSSHPSKVGHFFSTIGNDIKNGFEEIPKIVKDAAPYASQLPLVGPAIGMGRTIGTDMGQAIRPPKGGPVPGAAAGFAGAAQPVPGAAAGFAGAAQPVPGYSGAGGYPGYPSAGGYPSYPAAGGYPGGYGGAEIGEMGYPGGYPVVGGGGRFGKAGRIVQSFTGRRNIGGGHPGYGGHPQVHPWQHEHPQAHPWQHEHPQAHPWQHEHPQAHPWHHEHPQGHTVQHLSHPVQHPEPTHTLGVMNRDRASKG